MNLKNENQLKKNAFKFNFLTKHNMKGFNNNYYFIQ